MNYRVVAYLLSAMVASSFGCTQRKSQGEVRSAMPDDGRVRVLFTRVKEQSDYTHYKWSFVGDRNWAEPSCIDAKFRIENSSKLNSPTSRGGCFTWEIDVESKKSGPFGGWESKGEIRGSNGKTAKLGATTGQCVVEQTSDSQVSVGNEINLGKVGQSVLTAYFAK